MRQPKKRPEEKAREKRKEKYTRELEPVKNREAALIPILL